MPVPFRALLTTLLVAACASPQSYPPPTTKWSTSSPQAEGLDPAKLELASRFIQDECPTRLSLLIVRHGKLVFERYYHGARANQANNIISMSKSVLSVLVGIALEQHLLRGLDQKVVEFFPKYFQPGDDPRKREVTLEQLLTMSGAVLRTAGAGLPLGRCHLRQRFQGFGCLGNDEFEESPRGPI